MEGRRWQAYVFPDNGAEARDPHDTRARDLVNIQTLARENRLPKSLAFIVADNTLRTSEQCILAHTPLLVAIQTQCCDIAETVGGEEQLAGSGECRVVYFAAGDELGEREFHGAF